jgi:hypothetical protein
MPTVSASFEKPELEPGMVVHAFNPSTWEAEAGGSRVPGQPELYSKTLSQKKKKKKKRKGKKKNINRPQDNHTMGWRRPL